MIRCDQRLAHAIGERIKLLRLARGWTQKEVAERVGSYRPIICRIETGLHVPTVQTLARFADAFGLDLAGLLAGVDSTPVALRSSTERRSA